MTDLKSIVVTGSRVTKLLVSSGIFCSVKALWVCMQRIYSGDERKKYRKAHMKSVKNVYDKKKINTVCFRWSVGREFHSYCRIKEVGSSQKHFLPQEWKRNGGMSSAGQVSSLSDGIWLWEFLTLFEIYFQPSYHKLFKQLFKLEILIKTEIISC